MPQKPVSKSSFGRLSVALAAVAVLLPLSMGLSHAQAQDSIREAQQRQAEIEAEHRHATDGIAYLDAQEYAVVKGYEEATAVLEAEQAKINALQQALNATTFQLNQLELNIAEFRQQLAAIHDTAAELAVQRYMHNGVDPVEVLFANANLSEGLALLALTETLFGDAADAIAQGPGGGRRTQPGHPARRSHASRNHHPAGRLGSWPARAASQAAGMGRLGSAIQRIAPEVAERSQPAGG